MELVRQPPKSFCCGQCCVAMLAGISRKQACKKFGTKGVTTTKAVVRACRKLGLTVADGLKTFRRETALPRLCLLVQRWEGRRNGHWVVYRDGLIYCPGQGIYPFAEMSCDGSKCTSYLAIERDEPNTAVA